MTPLFSSAPSLVRSAIWCNHSQALYFIQLSSFINILRLDFHLLALETKWLSSRSIPLCSKPQERVRIRKRNLKIAEPLVSVSNFAYGLSRWSKPMESEPFVRVCNLVWETTAETALST